MSDPVFLEAFQNVRASMSEQEWLFLAHGLPALLIYEEMRRIDNAKRTIDAVAEQTGNAPALFPRVADVALY